MSYTISVKVLEHNDRDHLFSIVEKTNWFYANGGTWAECNGVHTLTMGGSGTSGMLRFSNRAGEYFLVALGVHNYKRWCDIVMDAKSDETGVAVHPTYYGDGPRNRNEMLWKQLPLLEKTSAKGTKVKVDICSEESDCLWATITITTVGHQTGGVSLNWACNSSWPPVPKKPSTAPQCN